MALGKRPSLSQWNPFKYHIAEEVQSGDFVGSHTVLIAAGPPRLSDLSLVNVDTLNIGATGGATTPNQLGQGSDPVFPIGIVQSASVTQNKQLQRLFEIGSYRSYFIPGRVIGAVQLGVVLYDGPSLMRALYAKYHGGQKLTGDKNLTNNTLGPSDILGQNQADWKESPGSNEEFYINLNSDLFNTPVGLLFYITDNQQQPYGAFYCEDCYTQGHNISLNSGSVVLVEGVSIQFDRLIPVDVTIDQLNRSQSRS